MKLSIHAMHHHVTRTTQCTHDQVERHSSGSTTVLGELGTWLLTRQSGAPFPALTVTISLTHRLPGTPGCTVGPAAAATTHTCHHRSATPQHLPTFSPSPLAPLRNLENPKSGVSNLISHHTHPSAQPDPSSRSCVWNQNPCTRATFLPFPFVLIGLTPKAPGSGCVMLIPGISTWL